MAGGSVLGMPFSRNIIIPIGIAFVSALAGFFLFRVMVPEPNTGVHQSGAQETSLVGSMVPELELPDPQGRMTPLSTWKGRPMLINFWATWCPPCREEIPDLMALRHEFADRGLVIVGVALDEPDKVSAFVEEFGIEYPILVEPGRGMAMNRAFGNALGVLPYTVFVDALGIVRSIHRGALTRRQGRERVQSLLNLKDL